MEQTQKSWVGKFRTLPRKVLTGVIVQGKKRFKQRKSRYGPRYTKGMLATAFFTLFVPIPGISLVSIATIVVIAEVHWAISKGGGFPEAIADLVVVLKANMPCWATGRRQTARASRRAA